MVKMVEGWEHPFLPLKPNDTKKGIGRPDVEPWLANPKNNNWEPWEGKNGDYKHIYLRVLEEAEILTGLPKARINSLFRAEIIPAVKKLKTPTKKGTPRHHLRGEARIDCCKRVAGLIWSECKVDWKDLETLKTWIVNMAICLGPYEVTLARKYEGNTKWEASVGSKVGTKGEEEEVQSEIEGIGGSSDGGPRVNKGEMRERERRQPTGQTLEGRSTVNPQSTSRAGKRKLEELLADDSIEKSKFATPRAAFEMALQVWHQDDQCELVYIQTLEKAETESRDREAFTYKWLDYSKIWSYLRQWIPGFDLTEENSDLFWLDDGQLSAQVENNMMFQAGFSQRCDDPKVIDTGLIDMRLKPRRNANAS